MESAHLTNLFTYHGPLKHIDHTHRRTGATAGGRGDGLAATSGGRGDGLGSIPEDYHRRRKDDKSLETDLVYATHKQTVLRQLLEFAARMVHKSAYVQREINDHLPKQIAEEVEEIRKLNVEIARRRDEGIWSLA